MDDKLTRMFHELGSDDLTSVDVFLRELTRRGYVESAGVHYGVRNTVSGEWLAERVWAPAEFQPEPHFFTGMLEAQRFCSAYHGLGPLEVVGVRMVPVSVQPGMGKLRPDSPPSYSLSLTRGSNE